MNETPQKAPQIRSDAAVVRVALRVALDQTFEYLTAADQPAKRGDVVNVTLRGKATRGVVVESPVHPTVPREKLKTIAQVEPTPLAPDQLALCKFVAQYYHAPVGMAYALALSPAPVAQRKAAACVPTAQPAAPTITLNAAQAHAAQAIRQALGTHTTFCLHGITGSGKTEVYVAVMRAVIARGEQALVLVPEINLTPQWIARLKAQLPDAQCVALHSALSDGERFRAWSDAASGQAQVLFGTRMSVFVPLPALGLIIVDEEHDASFKQQETPRYHARDLAVLRAKERHVPVVLGSATPSLETFANVENSRYRLLTLSDRAAPNAQPPFLRIIPARDTKKTAGLTAFLLQALEDRLARGEQSLIFLNRRGFSPLLHCHVCDWRAQCTQCDASLVFHAFDQRLRCHHCGEAQNVPDACPSCGNIELLAQGLGTQKIESYLRRRYPSARIARADADTTRGKHDWATLYTQMAVGELDILVGTQMISKGHDFPRLTLVGVVGADDALYSADFRAPERLFAQLTQVAGRAGRADLPGEVLIQSDMPDHPVLRALVTDDFTAFARRELAEREAAQLPPSHALALVRVEGVESTACERILQHCERGLSAHPLVTTFPPVPSPLARRAARFRWQMMLTSSSRAALRAALHALPLPQNAASLHCSIDVDPIDLT